MANTRKSGTGSTVVGKYGGKIAAPAQVAPKVKLPKIPKAPKMAAKLPMGGSGALTPIKTDRGTFQMKANRRGD